MVFHVRIARAVDVSSKGKPDPNLLLRLLLHQDEVESVCDISPKERDAVWKELKPLVGSAFAMLFAPDDVHEADGEEKENVGPDDKVVARNLLHSAILLISTALQTDGCEEHSSALFDTMRVLHDSLLRIDDGLFGWNAKDRISHLCEKWFTSDREGKEMVAAQTISYLLMKSLADGAKSSDVKRVHAIRKALLLLDFADESSSSLKTLLLYCFGSSLYLKSSEGCKFLVFLFGLYPPFIDQIHSTIKSQIVVAGKPALEAYGDMYFKAWKNATGPYLTIIEYGCIQDLMNHAVHAQWRPSNGTSFTSSMASRLRKVLERIHNQKKFRGVDGMLYRLYEPILWRSLKVANSVVRRNATALLIDAFPLEDPEAPTFEKDANLQRHFDCLEDLLKDPAMPVRVVAVQGICKIFAIYWEVIPAKVLSDFLSCIINELAYDTSSNMTRISVLQGLTFLLENMMLSHAMLKPKLVSLGKLFHDQAEKVRVAFLDMMIVISGIKDIKFYEIVEIPLLLARLESDSPSVCKRITSLLTNSFFPLKKTVGVQIERCKFLLETNRIAARNYYFYLVKYVPEESVDAFVVGLVDMLKLGLSAAVVTEAEPKAKKMRPRYKKPDPDAKAKVVDEEVMNMIREHFDGFLEVVAILLNGVSGSTKKANTSTSSALSTISLSSLLDHAQSPAGRAAAYSVACYLPEEFTDSLREAVSASSAATDGLAAVTCLSSSGRVEFVVGQVLDWLRVCPLGTKLLRGPTSTKGKKKAGNSAKDVDELCRAGERGLTYLSLLLSDPTLRESFLSLQQSKEIFQILSNAVTIAADVIAGRIGDLQFRVQHRLVISSLEAMLRLAMHRHASSGNDNAFNLEPYLTLVGNVDGVFLDRIRGTRESQASSPRKTETIPKRSTRKRRAAADSAASSIFKDVEADRLESLLETILKMGVEIVSLGRSKPGFTAELTRRMEAVMKKMGTAGIRWIPMFVKHVEQLSQLAELETASSSCGRKVCDGEGGKGEEEAEGEEAGKKAFVSCFLELLRFLHRTMRDADALRKELTSLSRLLTDAARVEKKEGEEGEGEGERDELDSVLEICLDCIDENDPVVSRWIAQTLSKTIPAFGTRVSMLDDRDREGKIERLKEFLA